VATYSTGISATWNSVTFTEIVGLSWNYGGENNLRSALGLFNFSHGSVSIEARGTTPTNGSIGTRGQLAITGGNVGLTIKAVFKSVSVAAELNGVTRTSVEFDIFED